MVKKYAFKVCVLLLLLVFGLLFPPTSFIRTYKDISAWIKAGKHLKEIRLKSEESLKLAKNAEEEFINTRQFKMSPFDPVAISEVIQNLDGVVITKINALSIEGSPKVVGTYSPETNQWCEGLEFYINTNNLEDTLNLINKMELIIISIDIKIPNRIILRINTKGV